jgi:hypothetical protein
MFRCFDRRESRRIAPAIWLRRLTKDGHRGDAETDDRAEHYWTFHIFPFFESAKRREPPRCTNQ